MKKLKTFIYLVIIGGGIGFMAGRYLKYIFPIPFMIGWFADELMDMRMLFFFGYWPKYFIRRIEQGEDSRVAFIGYKNYFFAMNLFLFAFKIYF